MEDKLENPLRLPIPFKHNGKIIVSAEYDAPDLGSIADTKKFAKQNIWRAVAEWINGGVTSYITEDGIIIDNRDEIKSITFDMPMRSAETLAIFIVAFYNEDDRIEGIYKCPLCDQTQIAEYNKDYDTCDRISDLQVISNDKYEESVIISLENPIEIKGVDRSTKQEIILKILKIEMKHPTIKIGINSMGKYGARDDIRQQFAYYIDSLISLDDEEVSQKERSEMGMKLFEKIKSKTDKNQLNEAISGYGIDNRVDKLCGGCGHSWKAEVNTSSFFDSALQ